MNMMISVDDMYLQGRMIQTGLDLAGSGRLDLHLPAQHVVKVGRFQLCGNERFPNVRTGKGMNLEKLRDNRVKGFEQATPQFTLSHFLIHSFRLHCYSCHFVFIVTPRSLLVLRVMTYESV